MAFSQKKRMTRRMSSFLSTPPLLSVAGVVKPLGSFFSGARLREGPGQRWRALGRR